MIVGSRSRPRRAQICLRRRDAAGEGDLRDVGMRDERRADARPEARHHVDDAGRHEVGGAGTNSTTLGAANSDGLSTTVLPAASAGPTL